ncbi:MAG: hypothetical protein R6W83_10630 [Cryobacterium sp.]
MTHSYPLHTSVQATCLCCHMDQPFTFASVSDHVVCARCVHHLSADKAERRDTEHVVRWAAHFAEEQQANTDFIAASVAVATEKDAEIARLSGEVAELSRVVSGTFERGDVSQVRALLEGDLIKRAERKAELAGKRVDWSMAVLWRLSLLHGVDAAHPQRCRCGASSAGCAELAALEPLRQALTDWEEKNVKLLAAGKRSALPTDHPAVLSAAAVRGGS